jgi:hypothetical protein
VSCYLKGKSIYPYISKKTVIWLVIGSNLIFLKILATPPYVSQDNKQKRAYCILPQRKRSRTINVIKNPKPALLTNLEFLEGA